MNKLVPLGDTITLGDVTISVKDRAFTKDEIERINTFLKLLSDKIND